MLSTFKSTGLNDRDLIGIGGKYTITEAKGEKYIFLYRVYAPSNWGEEDNRDVESEAGRYQSISLYLAFYLRSSGNSS